MKRTDRLVLKLSVWLLVLLAGLALAGCTLFSPALDGPLAFDDLWQQRQRLAGQTLTVSGYYVGGFETSALLAGPDNQGPGFPRCWVSGEQPMFGAENMAQPVEGWVRLSGVFRYDAGQRYGHLGGYDCEFEAETVEELSEAP